MGLKDLKDSRSQEHGWQYKEKKESGYRVISPSGISKFLSNPFEWKTNVIDGTPTFFGNEATVVGSLVHKYIECYRDGSLTSSGKIPAIQRDSILATTTDYDIQKITKDYPLMCQAVKENYLEVYPNDVESEKYMELDIKDDKILVAGTIDEYDEENKVITDFKTCSKAPSDKKDLIPYMYQLSVYANLLKATEDKIVETFRVVFIQRPTKTIGARIYVAECEANYELGKIVNEAIDIIRMTDEKPELLNLIFRENPLSGYTIVDKNMADNFIEKHIKKFVFTTQEQSKINKLKDDVFKT